MKEFLKTTIVGGVLFLLPVALVLFILGYAVRLAAKVVQPISNSLHLDRLGDVGGVRIDRDRGAPRDAAHRVTGGGRPPPVPTERSVRISRTTLFGRCFTALLFFSLLFVQVSFPWSADLLFE
jgi:hypothetical protein